MISGRQIAALVLLTLGIAGCATPPSVESLSRSSPRPAPKFAPEPYTTIDQRNGAGIYQEGSGGVSLGQTNKLRVALFDRGKGDLPDRKMQVIPWGGANLSIQEANVIGGLTVSYADNVAVGQTNRLIVIIDETAPTPNFNVGQSNALYANLTNTEEFSLKQLNELSFLNSKKILYSGYYRRLKQLWNVKNVQFYNSNYGQSVSYTGKATIQQAIDIVIYVHNGWIDYFSNGPVSYTYTPFSKGKEHHD